MIHRSIDTARIYAFIMRTPDICRLTSILQPRPSRCVLVLRPRRRFNRDCSPSIDFFDRTLHFQQSSAFLSISQTDRNNRSTCSTVTRLAESAERCVKIAKKRKKARVHQGSKSLSLSHGYRSRLFGKPAWLFSASRCPLFIDR